MRYRSDVDTNELLCVIAGCLVVFGDPNATALQGVIDAGRT